MRRTVERCCTPLYGTLPLGARVAVGEVGLAEEADAEHAEVAQREEEQLAEGGAR